MADNSRTIQSIPEACPQCGGRIYDNSKSKRNPKAPDAKCADQQNCGWAAWLPKPQNTGSGANRGPQGPSMPHSTMQKLCVQFQLKHIVPLLKEAGLTVTAENVLAGAATLMINGSKGGMLFPPKAEPQQAAPPPPPPTPYREPTYEDEHDLPF